MGFQDNSGDIILDMVLTDYGRQKLAKGEGLGVTQFALGDEEINYRLFDKTAASYQQDLSILQTPVLEAFTNNASSLKSRLTTYTNENLFYLPIMKINEQADNSKRHTSLNTFLICVNGETENNNQVSSVNATTALGVGTAGAVVQGILWGAHPSRDPSRIRIDTGIDNVATLNNQSFAAQSFDDQFILRMDGRLGKPVDINGQSVNTSLVSEDDDGIKTYILQQNSTANIDSTVDIVQDANSSLSSQTNVIAGFKHRTINFKIQTTPNLQSSNYYFDLLGNTGLTLEQANGVNNTNVKYIDSLIHIEGVTTGYSLSIPIRYIKI